MVEDSHGHGHAEEGRDGRGEFDEEGFFLEGVGHAGEDAAGVHGGGGEEGVLSGEVPGEVDEGEFGLAVALGVVLEHGK